MGELYLGGPIATYYYKDWTLYKKFFTPLSTSAFIVGIFSTYNEVWLDDVQVIEKD